MDTKTLTFLIIFRKQNKNDVAVGYPVATSFIQYSVGTKFSALRTVPTILQLCVPHTFSKKPKGNVLPWLVQ